MQKYTKGFFTTFMIILIAIAVLVAVYWDEIRYELRENFSVGEERNTELRDAIEETNP